MNLNDCQTVLSLICMNLDRQVPEGLDVLWAATLADIPAQYGKAAAMECIQSSPFMPKVADIRDRAGQMQEVDERNAVRHRRLALERAKTPPPERQPDGAAMAGWAWTETRKRATGITDPDKRADISMQVIEEWRQSHPGTTTGPRANLTCSDTNCRCTHTGGCDAGWIQVTADENGCDRVMPCPNCNHRRHQILTAHDRREVAMHNLRDTSDIKRP